MSRAVLLFQFLGLNETGAGPPPRCRADTLQGVPEVAAVDAPLGLRNFPRSGRIRVSILNIALLIGNVPLQESPAARDPLLPLIPSFNLVSLLQLLVRRKWARRTAEIKNTTRREPVGCSSGSSRRDCILEFPNSST